MKPTSTDLLTPKWYSRLARYSKLFLGFSGGLDSTVLLHVLASFPCLKSKIVAVHVNHGISPNASSWQSHCEEFCLKHEIALIAKAVQLDCSANVEDRARQARYEVFSSLMTPDDCMVLGHHQNDQAETVLLQLVRGAGVDGLAAMAESMSFAKSTLIRPFLTHSRTDLEHYARRLHLSWIEDESNENIHYSRNYLRHKILPLLVEQWPGVVGNIARTATHCQQAKNNLDELALKDYENLVKDTLSIEPLLKLNFDRIANILRVWIRKNQIKPPATATFERLINELIFARQDAVPEVSWGDVCVRRFHHHLYLYTKNISSLPICTEWKQFPSPVIIETSGISLSANQAKDGVVIPPEAKITIRFRQGGETIFYHGQTKRLKKLFQEWQIPHWEREKIPLIYINEELAVVVGFAVSDAFFSKNSVNAWSFSVSSFCK